MKIKHLPEIPNSWVIALIAVMLIFLRWRNIDSWVTATLSLIVGWLVGVKMEQTRRRR